MEEMSIPEPERALKMYPHQMSGGMKQRAMIAMSLSCNPRILIADEPTTAVDVTIRAQIMNILLELKSRRNMSIIFITHDLSLVREIGDRAAVVYGGKVVEIGTVEDILQNPAHPYTRGLISCLPDMSTHAKRLPSIPGTTPNPIDLPCGCSFNPRCPNVMDICYTSYTGIVEHFKCSLCCLPHVYSGGEAVENMENRPILQIKDLKKYYAVTAGLIPRKLGEVKAVDGVSLTINRGEVFGLVGESGCGKSTLGKTILRLEEPTSGEIIFNGVGRGETQQAGAKGPAGQSADCFPGP